MKPARVVLEPTGGYERGLIAALVEAKLPAICVNPKQARDFIKGIGFRAKTDRVDAEGLALFGERARPEVRALPNDEQRAIIDLMARRRQLVSMRTSEKNRLDTARGRVRLSIEGSLAMLTKLIEDLDKDIDTTVDGSPTWKGTEARLRAAKGVGPIVARTLLALLPELGTVTGKRIASLVGVAPFARDSGNSRGRRVTSGGRGEVRSMLVLAARSAAHHDPETRAFYLRLLGRGKEPMQAIVACARRLLVRLNAMMRDATTWAPPALSA
jgi:transposase